MTGRAAESVLPMPDYVIEGQRVTCSVSDTGKRYWEWCGCPDFAERATKFGEGFCAHTVVAIEQAYLSGQISLPTDVGDVE